MALDTYSGLQSSVALDGATGKLYWKTRPVSDFKTEGHARAWNNKYAGKEAFACVSRSGYLHGRFRGKVWYAHKVVYALAYGKWPESFVDHINGNKTDNRVENLRAANHAQNARNMFRNYGTSKYKGVHKTKYGWIAQVKGDKKNRYLGTFPCETSAAIAYDRACIEAHGEYALPNIKIAEVR